jgi:hypothetical protein
MYLIFYSGTKRRRWSRFEQVKKSRKGIKRRRQTKLDRVARGSKPNR